MRSASSSGLAWARNRRGVTPQAMVDDLDVRIADCARDLRRLGADHPSIPLLLTIPGVGHVLATDAIALDTDTRGVDGQWSENATADSFGKNLVFAPCESRYATSIYSPLGVVTLDLTA